MIRPPVSPDRRPRATDAAARPATAAMSAVLLAMAAAAAIGCSAEAPSIDALAPTTGPAGATVVLTGANFAAGTTVKLGGRPLDGLAVVDPGRIEGRVPGDLEPGPKTLVVMGPGGQSASRSKAFEVTVEGELASPCADDQKRMTHIPPSADVIKISVFVDPDATPPVVKTEEIKVSEIERVEYEARAVESSPAASTTGDSPQAAAAADPAVCSAIYLRTKTGRRVLFDASTKTSLKSQAQKIANGIARPIDVVHEDPAPRSAD